VATPHVSELIHKHKVSTTTEHLRSSISLARQTAISSNYDVYICALKDLNSCDQDRPFNADWSNGWLVFIDINNNADLDDKDDIIRIQSQQQGTGIIFNQRGRLRFRLNGSARSAGFYICNNHLAKHILILYSGRTRVKKLDKKTKINLCQNSVKVMLKS